MRVYHFEPDGDVARLNAMTKIFDDPRTFATMALAGFGSVHRDTVRLVRGGVVRATRRSVGKVALVVGGGSGHYPAFAGFVGPGLADAAVIGDVFAAPSAQAVAHVARLAHCGGGLILSFGNYVGDVMNFGIAAARLRAEGIDVRVLPVTDDIASAPRDKAAMRRGVAGNLIVMKVTGAAAEAGLPIGEVVRIARKANERTASIGVAFAGCTLPGANAPLFTVQRSRMGIGLGVHGEPGISEEEIMPAAQLGSFLVEQLMTEQPATASDRVAIVLNGLGSSKYEELFVLWASIEASLARAGLRVVGPEVGEFVTSLDMAGCSLSITWLDDELVKFWLAPCDAPVLRRGSIIPTEPAAPVVEDPEYVLQVGPSSEAARAVARCVATLLVQIAAELDRAAEQLGQLDAIAGDGDHGRGMACGSTAASEVALAAVEAGAGAATCLALAADAWADRAGGTSGALWGLALRTWSGAFSDHSQLDAKDVVLGAQAALDAVIQFGGAHVGDKTMVDAFVPFVTTLKSEIEGQQTLATAWQAAAAAAAVAADATKHLTPKVGRARSHAKRSSGHPDAGAVSFALCASVAGRFMASTYGDQ